MIDAERTERRLSDIRAALLDAAELAARGEDAYRSDPALPLAFEALVNRVGDLSKRLIHADPDRFGDPDWRLAARTRDFVAHHYDRIDHNLLWRTVTVSFPRLLALADAARR